MKPIEWMLSNSPADMIQALPKSSVGRKLYLFGCACCRRIEPLFFDSGSMEAITTIEAALNMPKRFRVPFEARQLAEDAFETSMFDSTSAARGNRDNPSDYAAPSP